MQPFHKIVVSNISPFCEINADGPTLVRLNRTFTSAGATIFTPTFPGFVYLSAWPSEERPPGATSDARAAAAWRGSGPLLYLPFGGKWQITMLPSIFGGSLLPAIYKAEFSLISMPPEVAANYLQSPPSSYHVAGNFTVAPAATVHVFSAAGIDISTLGVSPAIWHNCTRLVIRLNTSPATDFRVGIGRNPTAAVGGILGGFATRSWDWAEIAGQSVACFNNTAGAIECWVEAHFL